MVLVVVAARYEAKTMDLNQFAFGVGSFNGKLEIEAAMKKEFAFLAGGQTGFWLI